MLCNRLVFLFVCQVVYQSLANHGPILDKSGDWSQTSFLQPSHNKSKLVFAKYGVALQPSGNQLKIIKKGGVDANLWADMQAMVDAGSNVVDVFGRLPAVDSEGTSASNGQAKRVAICSTGHVRTFNLDGVYSGMEENLVKTNPGNVDVFFIGHAGAFAGPAAEKSLKAFFESRGQSINDANDPSLKKALEFFGDTMKHQEISTDGGCEDLEKAWEADGVTGRTCVENGNFLQMAWLDHCVRTVQKQSTHYDLIVRTRPDVGVFEPIDWNKLSTSKVSYMQKDAGGRADWFYAMPTSVLDQYWKPISDLYLGGNTGLPDYTIFGDKFETNAEGESVIEETSFPAALVRGEKNVDCFRLVGQGQALAEPCRNKEKSGYFGQLHK